MASIKIAGIESESIVDGPGYRYVIFTQGCPHNCPGCHNPKTHDFNGGYWMDTEEILKQIKANPLLDGVTFSGGEPFCQAEALSGMIEDIRKLGLDIVVYTGYTWEQLREMSDPAVHDLLKGTDILIDGPFIEAEKDLTLTFRGSRNQRLIDVNKTLEQGFIQLTDL